MPIRPQSAKNKGRLLQQKVRNDLLRIFSQLSDDDVRSTSMGAHGEDIQLSQAARTLIPYSFECKNVEQLNIWDAIKQARTNKPDNSEYVVVFKKNNEDPQAVVDWKTLLKLLQPDSTGVRAIRTQLCSIAEQLTALAGPDPTFDELTPS